ncbi:MAG: 50S ribosomal protein L28 [Firmicutes bacterium]|jgi:ribosomal protein L28|nr:50S ribosomal protein L28 [Bacillota bacterium]
MAVNVSNRKPNFKNIRSHALNSTKKKQGLNLVVVRDVNGKKYRVSAKELRTLKKDQQIAA